MKVTFSAEATLDRNRIRIRRGENAEIKKLLLFTISYFLLSTNLGLAPDNFTFPDINVLHSV
jgi:hypothetical protein